MVINPIIFIINDYENNVGYPHKFDNIILLNLCCNYFFWNISSNYKFLEITPMK